MNKSKILKLIKQSSQIRLDTFNEFYKTGEAHLGGSFSMIEILIYTHHMLMNIKKDKFILSKSHASFPYVLLLRNYGFKPKLKTHLELDPKNNIHCTTGSLGHGLPISTGMAMANKINGSNKKIFTLISDGECQEGTTWESFLIISKLKLNNLVVLIDYNKIQALTKIKDGLPLGSLKKKIESFDLSVTEIKDGHSFIEMQKKIKIRKNSKPQVFIFNTIKGKGIKEFENDPVWHAKKIRLKEYALGIKRLKN